MKEQTQNKNWGFWGKTEMKYLPSETLERWDIAFSTLERLSNFEPDVIRRFLDSEAGRELAEQCFNADIYHVINSNYDVWIKKELCKFKEISDEEFYYESAGGEDFE